MIEAVAQIAMAAVGLECARLAWHGRWQGHRGLISLHAALAGLQAGQALPWLAVPAVLTVALSWALLNAKRAGAWPGELASGLSSYPWQILALSTLGWPDGGSWSLPSLWILASLPIAWAAGLPWVSWLRPVHWTPSRHVWAYPRRLRVIMGGR